MGDNNYKVFEGDSDSFVLIHVPHASRLIPESVRESLLLEGEDLSKELDKMTDTYSDTLAHNALENCKIRPWLFVNNLSRFVVDPERFPDETEIMNSVGMGAVYFKTSSGNSLRGSDKEESRLLISKYFNPYSKSIQAVAEMILSNNKKLTILDLHTYRVEAGPNELNLHLARPEICLGTDSRHTPKQLLNDATNVFSEVGKIVENEPFSGTYVPLSLYGKNLNVQSIMIEIREDVILDENLEPHEGAENVSRLLARYVNLLQGRE